MTHSSEVKRYRVISIMGFLMMVAGLSGLVLTKNLFSRNAAAVAAQILAVILLVWARREFGIRSLHLAATPTQGALITTGPYQWIRHPVYTAYCMFIWAGALAHFSARALLFALVVSIGSVARVLCEERLLATTYPEFREYAARTSRMIPGVF